MLVPIDTKLGSLLEASHCLIHCGFDEFLARILSSAKEKRGGYVIPLPVRSNTQTEVGDGTTTTTKQEANKDRKSLTSAILQQLRTQYKLIRNSAYSIF